MSTEESKIESKEEALAPFGKFIVFEGIDGSGKSTHAKHLYEHLKARGVSVVLTEEPWKKGVIGQFIRQILTGKMEAPQGDSMAMLFESDRLDHKHWIREQLENGVTVLCDRYELSTIAYQATWHPATSDEATRTETGRKRSLLRRLQRAYSLPADLTFVFNLPVDEALRRLEGRKNLDMYETRMILEAAALFYKNASDACSTHVYVDARQPETAVKEVIEREAGALWSTW